MNADARETETHGPRSPRPTKFITDDEVLALWREARPSPGQDNEMTWEDFDEGKVRPMWELRRLVELAIERGIGISTDTKRLNWIERNVRWDDSARKASITFHQQTVMRVTLREAIDAAMRDPNAGNQGRLPRKGANE